MAHKKHHKKSTGSKKGGIRLTVNKPPRMIGK